MWDPRGNTVRKIEKYVDAKHESSGAGIFDRGISRLIVEAKARGELIVMGGWVGMKRGGWL